MADYRRHLAACVESGRFSPAEADLIGDFVAELAALAGMSGKWRENVYHMVQSAAMVCHDATGARLDVCTTGDVLATVAALRDRARSPNYIRAQVYEWRRFAVWLASRRPELDAAKIAAVKLPRGRWKNRRPEDMLTYDEVLAAIAACRTSRDRCLIAMLYDGANRPSELLALRWGDIVADQYGAWFETTGKTGRPRRIRLTLAVPYLAQWRADSPDTSPGAPLFCTLRRFGGEHRPLRHDAIETIVRHIRAETGLEKVTSYVFRPSRITHDVEAGLDTSYIAMRSWGSLKTPMLDKYTNPSTEWIDATALSHAGIRARPEEARPDPLRPVECPRCVTLNVPGARFCSTCMLPLTAEAAHDDEALSRLIVSRPDLLIKVLERIGAEKGNGS
jgi:integrase